MIKLSLESLASKKEEVVVQDIHFPPSEHEALRKQTTIITHRVSDDADKFEQGDYVYAEDIDNNYCFEVSSKKIIKKIEDSPYFKDLTAGQVTYLKKFDKIAVLTLKKTKYERPYKLSYIKENYPPKVYEMLKKDKCHCWRARTGIDMIHLEPDDAEQKRTCKNWELLPKYLKDASDDKSIELFGCDNKSHEKMLVIDRIKKYFRNIEYGLRDPKTGKGQGRFNGINTTGKDYDEKWRLGTAEETIKCGCGICFDTVELSRELLKKESNLQFKVYFGYCITEEEDSQAPTHTFLLYKSAYNQEWAWLEGSWGPYMSNDIHSTNPNDLVRMIGIELANASGYEQQIMDVTNCYPKTGSTMREFQHICYYEGKKVMTVKPTESSLESLKEKKDSPAVAKAKKYLEELSKFKVSNNCQKFAAALELKFRGQDEKVTETSSPVAKVFDVPVGRKSPIANWCLIKNATFTKISENDPIASITKTMKGWGENARAIISVAWKSGRGHVFNLAVLDGEVYLLDATANRIKPIEKSEYLKNKLDAKNSDGLIRTDTGSINSEMKKDTFSADEQEISLDDPEPKYISVLQALGKEGSKGKSFEVYRQGKKIGTVRCDEVAQEYGNDFKVWNYSWR